MMTDHAFLPDPARARALDRLMHAELGRSLSHVAEAATFLDTRALRCLAARLQAGLSVMPWVFGTYYDLVSALLEEDEPQARAHAARLIEAPDAPGPMQVVSLGAPALGPASALYATRMSEEGAGIVFLPPDPAVAAAFHPRLEAGLALLDRALPALAGEVRAIVRQVVIAGGDPASRLQFDGGSHYQLWGALFLNGAFHPDPVAVAEVLAHESAHSLLFGFCTHESLVENADEERYPSPLREDLRPMDGIYHATFVSARMHWAMSALAASGALNTDEIEAARAAAASDLRNFDAGDSVVRAHGRLTATGAALLEGARAYVDAVR